MVDIGTAVQAIEYALTIDDAFEMKDFLTDWQCGDIAGWEDYSDWLEEA